MKVALQEEPPVGETSVDTAGLRQLYAELARRGLLEPSHLWRWKLPIWTPAFFLAYLGLVALPFGPLWLLLAPLAASRC